MRINDWSSDVCSSDLCIIGTFPSACAQEGGGAITPLAYAFHPTIWDIFDRSGKTNFAAAPPFSGSVSPDIQLLSSEARKATIAATSSGRPERLTVRNCLIIGPVKIGRASCRERVCQYV